MFGLFVLIVMVFAGGAQAADKDTGRYNADGPYAVTTAMLTVPSPNGTFTTTAYIPENSRPHPVVVFSSGFMQSGIAYAPYAKRLASWGIIAFLQDDAALVYSPAKAKFPDEPNDNPTITEIAVKAVSGVSYQASTWLQNINADGPLHGMVDTSRIGLAGHSRGAQIALLAAEGLPSHIRGVFGLDPVDLSFGTPKAGMQLANIGIPVALILLGSTITHFTMWLLLPPWPSRRSAPTTPCFKDPTNCRFCGLCTKGTANPSIVLGYSVRYLTAFFTRELLGDTSVGAAFEGAGATEDVKAGLIQIASK